MLKGIGLLFGALVPETSLPSSDSSDVMGVVGRLPLIPSPISLSLVVAAECQLDVEATELAEDGSRA